MYDQSATNQTRTLSRVDLPRLVRLADDLNRMTGTTAMNDREYRLGVQEITEEFQSIAKVLTDLMPFVMEDYYPNCATPAYRDAVEAAKMYLPNACLSHGDDSATPTPEKP